MKSTGDIYSQLIIAAAAVAIVTAILTVGYWTGKVDAGFEKVEIRFNNIDARLDRSERNVNGRLDRVNGRLDRIERNIESMGGKLDSLILESNTLRN